MAGAFSVRNTALGAGALVAAALLVTDRSGLGWVVDKYPAPKAEVAPQPEQSHVPKAAPAEAPPNWFAPTPEVNGPVAPIAQPPAAPAVSGEIRPPDPVGPDFPPELNARR